MTRSTTSLAARPSSHALCARPLLVRFVRGGGVNSALLTAVALLLSACGGGGGGHPPIIAGTISTGGTTTASGNLSGILFQAQPSGLLAPLAGAKVLVDGADKATTASDGSFSADVTKSAAALVTVDHPAASGAELSLNTTTAQKIYLIVREIEGEGTILQAVKAAALTQRSDLSQESAATVSTVVATSLDGSVRMVFANGSQIISPAGSALTTVAVHVAPITTHPPMLTNAEKKGVPGQVVAAAEVTVRDGVKKQTLTRKDYGFTGQIRPTTTTLLNTFTPAQLNDVVNVAKAGTLALWYLASDFNGDGTPGNDRYWAKAGTARLDLDSSNGKYTLSLASASTFIPGPYNFAFVLDTGASSAIPTVTAGIKIKDQATGAPIPGALVVVEGQSFTSTENGGVTAPNIPVPFTRASITVSASAKGYQSAEAQVPVTPGNPNIDAEISLTPIVTGATISGTVREAGTNAAVEGAKVALVATSALSQMSVVGTPSSGGYLALGHKSDATYTYKIARRPEASSGGLPVAAEEITVKTGLGFSTLTSEEILAKIREKVAAGDTSYTSGTFDLRVEVAHAGGLTEAGQALFSLGIAESALSQTVTLSGGQVSIYGGGKQGFYYSIAPVGDTVPTVEWSLKLHGTFAGTLKTFADQKVSTYKLLYLSETKNFIRQYLGDMLKKFDSDGDGTADKTYLEDAVTLTISVAVTYSLAGVPKTETATADTGIQASPSQIFQIDVLNIANRGAADFLARSLVTDKNGAYTFKDVPESLSGKIDVRADKTGYARSPSLSVGTFKNGDTVSKDLTLTPET
ncbi:MAG: hypothetical protein HY719_13300, partial [Planctomycetes bacterium]|nr:hypothetical protein [Planctomycetota bacterium]